MKKLFLFLVLFLTMSIYGQWYNLQWPPSATINEGESVNVYAQIWIDGVTSSPGQSAGLQAWIGVNVENSDPATWSEVSWQPADFNGDAGDNDEFVASIGSNLSGGTYYYASRFLYEPPAAAKNINMQNIVTFWYGGLGGPWNNNSGVLTVNAIPTIGWANLQWPPNAEILEGNSFNVYAQVWMSGVTDSPGQGTGISAWFGVHTENNDPATWSEDAWQIASYLGDVGSNDEYTASIGSGLSEGTYYYASRFLYQEPDLAKEANTVSNGLNYYYGGFNGGAWDGVNNVSGVLTVTSVPDTVIDWANLQWPPEVNLLNEITFTVYGQVYEAGVTDAEGQGANVEAWFGLNLENTDPSTWEETSWVEGVFNVDIGNNDEYTADLSIAELLKTIGEIPFSFYYAARYRLNGGDFYYGAFQGGAWDGVNNVNGVGNFSISDISVIGWCNLQWPPSMSLDVGQSGTVYAQVWVEGITSTPGPSEEFDAYIGVHTENTNPSTWPQSAWIPAQFNIDVGNNDEYMADIGGNLEPGTYYYASRFIAGGVKSFYGGYNEGGGGFWDGMNNVSGILYVSSASGPTVDWCNLQWPPDGNIQEGNEFIVYSQAWKADVTNSPGPTLGLSAWIGANIENTNPASWDENVWLNAVFNVDVGNNDEFMKDIGSVLPAGTYYYASRFQYENGAYSYGGYNSDGGGFWDGTQNISGILIVEPATSVNDDNIPTTYSLNQNYPNPFNPSTSIRFSVPIQSKISLKIYDIMGREVTVLEEGIIETGIHTRNWNAKNLASGIYLLRFEATTEDNSQKFIEMKKITLLK